MEEILEREVTMYLTGDVKEMLQERLGRRGTVLFRSPKKKCNLSRTIGGEKQ